MIRNSEEVEINDLNVKWNACVWVIVCWFVFIHTASIDYYLFCCCCYIVVISCEGRNVVNDRSTTLRRSGHDHSTIFTN